MRRIICKWLIDRAVERGAATPAWVRRQIDGDDELARFEAASRQLSARLRRDAAGWMALQAEEVRGELPGPTRGRQARPRAVRAARKPAWAFAAGVAAACALVAVGWRLTRDDQPVAATISSAERQQLAAAWESGRANVSGWTARVKGAAGRFEALEMPETLFPPVDVADATARRLQAALESAVTSQREHLTSDMASAYRFFAHRLPASVAIFVGLQEREPPQVL